MHELELKESIRDFSRLFQSDKAISKGQQRQQKQEERDAKKRRRAEEKAAKNGEKLLYPAPARYPKRSRRSD